jgi:multidrug efflux pump subunit AcrA (membrane-fusion protein)
MVDAASRLGFVRIRLPLASRLLPGMFAHATIEAGRERALVVPSRAVLGTDGARYLFTLEGRKARRRTVEVGIRQRDDVAITSGLHGGEVVIVNGAGFLGDGDTVEVDERGVAVR